MEFSVQSYLRENWKDDRLNLSMYQNHTYTNPVFPTFLIKYLWVPDLIFDNTRNGKLFQRTLPNTNIKVRRDGFFMRSSRYNLIVGCLMDFHFYPMDTQNCFIKIATMSNPDYKVLLHWGEEFGRTSIALVNDIQPLKYVLEKPKSYKTTEVWASGNYTYLYANFTFVRRLSGSVFNVYIPSTLVVLLSWISFWLEVEAVPARVTLGVTSLLTLTTQVVQAHGVLPNISYMTAIDVWLFACLITVFSSLIEYALSYQIFVLSKQRTATKDSSTEVNDVQAKDNISILRPRFNEDARFKREVTDSGGNVGTSEKMTEKLPTQKSLDKICRILFPFVFSVFNIVYWTSFLYFK